MGASFYKETGMDYVATDRFLYLNTPLPENDLLVTAFSGSEYISQLFHFEILFRAKNGTSVPFEKLLGQKISFGVKGSEEGGEPRHFNGIVVQMAQLGRGTEFTDYTVIVAPKIWLLTQTVRSRIFQHKTVPDILKEVLADQDLDSEIQDDPDCKFEPREYCVQYQESDFDFASRLMEEEGIYYFFKFTEDAHTMVLGNTRQSHIDIPGGADLIFDVSVGGNREEERVYSWKKQQDFRSGKYTLWDHHFQLPHKNLSADQIVRDAVSVGTVTHKLKTAGNDALEIYENPGRYAQRFDGIDKGGGENAANLEKIYKDNKRTASIRMQQVEAPLVLIEGESNCRQLTSGHKFNLQRHYSGDGQYVTVMVVHDARQGHYRSSETSDDEFGTYRNNFACMPFTIPFRPQRNTPRPTIRGCQTAVVTGPEGAEIFTDKYGRVKVHFHWDRDGSSDADSSCWLRVGTPWAGKNWGAICIPRVGHEVIVDFIEGDPDRPIIVGGVYNADMMPPYDLPANQTRSTMKSHSSPGGGGFNEIRFEDQKDKEEIFIHGQKDFNAVVVHDETRQVGNSRTTVVQEANDTLTVAKGDRSAEVTKGNDELNVKAGNITIKAPSGTYHLEAVTVEIQGSATIKLTCGASTIEMTPGTITLTSPMIKLNC